MKRWWFLLTRALAKIGRRPSLSISMYLAEFVTFTHHKFGLSIMPNCNPNHYRKATMFNCWLQSIHPKFLIRWSPHPYTTTAWELGEWGLIREDHSLPKVMVSWSPPWPACISWLCWLVRSGLRLAALHLYLSLPRYLLINDTWWHTQLHLLWQISSWDSRFPFHWSLKASEVSCWWPRMTRTGFYSLIRFVLELGDDTVHSGQWNGQIPGYLSLTCISLFLTNNCPPLKIWVPKNPVTEVCWFTLWCIIPQYITHSNH